MSLQTNTILILSPQITPRLKYITNHIFKYFLGLNVITTTDRKEFLHTNDPKINYTTEKFSSNIPHIFPTGLLFEKHIQPNLSLAIKQLKDWPVIFYTYHENSYPFDIFSAAFYFLSRYEEFIDYRYDEHGRFMVENSLIFKLNCLYEPLVDLWIINFKKYLQYYYPFLNFKEHNYTYIPTIDVDVMFKYKYKGILRSWGSLTKNFFNFKWNEIKNFFFVNTNITNDPFDNFEYLKKVLYNYNYKPTFFYLCGKQGKYNPNNNYKFKTIQQIVKNNHLWAETGIHPSYFCVENPRLIDREKKKLETIVNTKITKNRFHFIRFQLPILYQKLIEYDIHEDFSMGFPVTGGFRAGTSHPFYFYNLIQDIPTTLKIYPFQSMDSIYIYHKNENYDNIIQHFKNLQLKIKQVGGYYIIIWHNNTFSTDPNGLQWRKIFEYFLI